MSFDVQEKEEGLVFTIHVQPRASKNKVVGPYGDALKVMLTAPPVDNAANKACCDFLAKVLKVKKTAVGIQSGQTGRNKRILIQCEQDNAVRKRLRETILRWMDG